jgi:hypothetical protein
MRLPDIEGPVGVAYDVTAALENAPARIAMWLVTGPFDTEVRWQTLSIITLDDIDGVDPAVKEWAGATHQFYIFNLAQEDLDIDEVEHVPGYPLTFESPPLVSVQLGGLNDLQAKFICQGTVQLVVQGNNPTTDSDWWKAVVLKGSETVRTGGMIAKPGRA